MRRKKVANSETPVQPGTKRVTVQEVYEEPIEEAVDAATEVEGYEPDPVEDFINRIEQERQLDMFVYALPNYFQDGRTAIRGTLRLFVTRFPFGPDDIATFEQRIQLAYPSGGMFDLELRDNGKPVKKFTRAVAPLPGHQSQQQHQTSGYPIIVNPPAAPASNQPQQPQLNPRDMLRDQMSFVKDMIQIAKEMTPAPIAPVQGPTDIANDPRFVEVQTRVAMMDKLIGLAGNNAPLAERLLGKFLNDEAGGEQQGPNWIQLGIELLKNAPTIIQSIAQYAPMMQARQPQQNGAGGYQPTITRASSTALPPAPANTDGQQQQQPPAAVDLLTQRWQQVIRRLVEDCAASASIDNSVNSVLDLYESAPPTRPTIDQLTVATPAEVITLCAASSNTQQEFTYVMGLAQYPAPLQWVSELQTVLREELEKLKVDLEQQPSDQSEQSNEEGE